MSWRCSRRGEVARRARGTAESFVPRGVLGIYRRFAAIDGPAMIRHVRRSP